MDSVVAFTDTYLPTVNGVTYTVKTWRDRWLARGGRMDVVYPETGDRQPAPGEHPDRSVPFPFYEGFRLGVPQVPTAVRDADVVHAHTPFAVGLGALRLVRRTETPLVTSYHTPTGKYADYLSSRERVEASVERLSNRYERWFFGHADVVLVPSEATREHVVDEVGVSTDVVVFPNGVDVEQFRPVETASFRERFGLGNGVLVGYTGRHGYEKSLDVLVDAAGGLDATVVFGGDGPARESLERQARDRGVDARFLGFLDREDLPAFYSALDAFVFPSQVETQGLVALEANACGTPVVGADRGALASTVVDGVTGHHFTAGDSASCRNAIRRTLDERAALGEQCLARRDAVSVERAVDRLEALYADL